MDKNKSETKATNTTSPTTDPVVSHVESTKPGSSESKGFKRGTKDYKSAKELDIQDSGGSNPPYVPDDGEDSELEDVETTDTSDGTEDLEDGEYPDVKQLALQQADESKLRELLQTKLSFELEHATAEELAMELQRRGVQLETVKV
jgi:putative cell wall-binding protein